MVQQMVWVLPLIWRKLGENDKWCPKRKMTLLKGRLEQKNRTGSGNVQRETASHMGVGEGKCHDHPIE